MKSSRGLTSCNIRDSERSYIHIREDEISTDGNEKVAMKNARKN